jgi:quercetin 2,3-dioxygenase
MVRAVTRVVTAEKMSEGAGVQVRRTIGTAALDHLDPFLLLDEFKSDRPDDYAAGFPDHPHRGFETVTYMLAGSMRHEDHTGARGELVAGSVQWMTAGRGIVHSEMPRQQDGLMWGFQLWVNLPARDKLCPPRYQDIPPEQVPAVALAAGVRARVIAGTANGTRGPVEGIVTEPLYLDVAMAPRSALEHPVPAGHTAFAYVFEGEAALGGPPDRPGLRAGAGRLAVFGEGDRVAAVTDGAPARFLLLAARPLREPIARYGPFVMNTREEIVQAMEDFRSGAFLR